MFCKCEAEEAEDGEPASSFPPAASREEELRGSDCEAAVEDTAEVTPAEGEDVLVPEVEGK